jgi:ribosomal-protein-alanine N-acetyltransferase
MLKIRQFSLADLKDVWQISRTSLPKRRIYSQNFFKKQYQLHSERFFVAEEEKVVGFALGQLKENMAEIASLAVEQAWRKKGIGTELINSLIRYFKKEGFREVFLYARINNAAAVSFYQNLDFSVSKTIKKHYSNGDDAYMMVKSI